MLTNILVDTMGILFDSRTNNSELCLQALCELPESYETYRKQQHRWHSGPMQLFRLCLPDIIASKVGFQSPCFIDCTFNHILNTANWQFSVIFSLVCH
jgi:hypothetical protein